MNKICTTIEQSKKLLELGIDVNTADMCWSIFKTSWGERIYTIVAYPMLPNQEKGIEKIHEDLPAWSLTALFGFLPEHTQVPSSLKQNKYVYNFHNGIVEFGDDCHKEKSINLFDAVFEMVCWLKENGKIKKGE